MQRTRLQSGCPLNVHVLLLPPHAIVEKGFIYLSPKLSHLEDSNDNICQANCLRSSQGPQKMVGDEVLGTVKAGGGVGH